jgi:endonuclease/exonuclease/phosphatase family metal-dependent hydrolase
MRAVTFNALADAYLSYGDYSHVAPHLLQPGARTNSLLRSIDKLDADIIGLQEAEAPLVRALEESGNWQTFWSPKKHGKADGCLTLVRHEIEVSDYEAHTYHDGSGHIMQILHIGRVAFANTHIKWAPADSSDHVGVGQMTELLGKINNERSAVIFADSNDRPNGPVRRLVEKAGFDDMSGDMPTAIVNGEAVALDIVAVRGIASKLLTKNYNVLDIPNEEMASDHIPLIVELELP